MGWRVIIKEAAGEGMSSAMETKVAALETHLMGFAIPPDGDDSWTLEGRKTYFDRRNADRRGAF